MLRRTLRFRHTQVLRTTPEQNPQSQSRATDDVEEEEGEVLLVAVTHTVVDPETVVVQVVHTDVADAAVVSAVRLPLSAGLAVTLFVLRVFWSRERRSSPCVTQHGSEVTQQRHPERELKEHVHVRSEVRKPEEPFLFSKPRSQSPLHQHPSEEEQQAPGPV